MLLVTRGARLDTCDKEGSQAIHVAAMLGHTDILAYLIAKGQSVDTKDASGRTPLMLGKHQEKEEYLIPILSPISALYKGKSLETVRLLVRLGASVTSPDPGRGNTALHWAMEGARPRLVSALVSKAGALPWHVTNHEGRSALDIGKAKPRLLMSLAPAVRFSLQRDSKLNNSNNFLRFLLRM